MLAILLYAFLAYILYGLIFKFIIPVYRTTRQVRKGIRQVQEQMRQQQSQYNQQQQEQPKKQPEKKAGEYIDFEEVK